MTDLINAHQATPLTGRAYNVVLGHIRKDYDRLKAGKPTRIFHTVVCVPGDMVGSPMGAGLPPLGRCGYSPK